MSPGGRWTGAWTDWTFTGPWPPNGATLSGLGGSLVFEVGAGQAPAVELILAQNGYENILTHQDTQGIWRVVEGTVNH